MESSIIILLIIAFFGGTIGASMSGMIAFGITCLIGLIGTISGNYVIVDNITFGPILFPFVVFSGGVASVAFASNKKKLFESGQAIMTPMAKFNDYTPILIGGCFGLVGYGLYLIFIELGIQGDLAAYIIVILNTVVRYLFGNTGLFEKKAFNEKPFIRNDFFKTLVLGLAFSVFSVYITHVTEELFLAFFISGLSFILLALGFNVPISHYITMPTAYAYVQTNNIWVAIFIGVVCAMIAPFLDKLVNENKDTYVDYPSIIISLSSFIIFYLM